MLLSAPDRLDQPPARPAAEVLAEATAPVAKAMALVNERLEALFPPSLGGLVPVVYHQLLQAGGKRLRPLLTLLSCTAAGGEATAAVTVAMSAEILHLASLIHDDVIDEAERRRGRPSAPQQWGNRAAVLVGDFLVAEVFQSFATDLHKDSLALMAHAVAEMARAELDFVASGAETTEADYLRNIQGKTGALMAAVCEAGAVAADNPGAAAPLHAYGQKLGEAFQLSDDLLDLYGTEATVGKPVLQDLRKGQWTLAVLYPLRTGQGEAVARLRQLLAAAPQDPAAARTAADLAAELGGRAYAQAMAEQAVASAHGALDQLPASPAREQLGKLADFVLRREQ